MFPYEDSKNRVCPYPEKINHLNFLNVSAVMFCKQFLAYTVHIDESALLINQSINIHVDLNIYLC